MMIYKRYETQHESHLHSVSHRVSDCKTFNLKILGNENTINIPITYSFHDRFSSKVIIFSSTHMDSIFDYFHEIKEISKMYGYIAFFQYIIHR